MKALIVSNGDSDWSLEVPGAEVVDPWTYLTDGTYSRLRNVRVFNLCGSYRYQSTGYYVSLLAEARKHRPMPSVMTIQDLHLRNQSIMRLLPTELEELIQHSLAPLQSDQFTLSVYFGRNLAARYDRLSRQLFDVFQCPMLQFSFARRERWQLRSMKALSMREVPDTHREFVVDAARTFFARRGNGNRGKRKRPRFDLAILYDPAKKENAPSNPKALERFVDAAEEIGLAAELVTRDDFGRLLEFDALFIRDTTQMNHYTYRWARRAEREGLVVIDDPQSIARCTNKVFLAEILNCHDVPIPKTILVHRENAPILGETLGYPCVLKKPDSAFSLGVVRVDSQQVLEARVADFFGESDMLVAQEYLPTDFDWRIGVLDHRPFFACKYFMAKGHWQIVRRHGTGSSRYGRCEAVPIEMAPRKVVAIALKAAKLIGDGLYGVDIKERNGEYFVVEVNDNPNLDAGEEDGVLRGELYRRIMSHFLQRIEQQKAPTYD